jgi:hypothetical protein
MAEPKERLISAILNSNVVCLIIDPRNNEDKADAGKVSPRRGTKGQTAESLALVNIGIGIISRRGGN